MEKRLKEQAAADTMPGCLLISASSDEFYRCLRVSELLISSLNKEKVHDAKLSRNGS
jgi:hypothetical protein